MEETQPRKAAESFRGLVRAGVYAVTLVGLMSIGEAASAIEGTGSLSGAVRASSPFQAAQVHALNVDKNILYMVYTNEGRYQAINMIPGNYEVHVQKRGFSADVQEALIVAGRNTTVDFTLHQAPARPLTAGPRVPDEDVQLVAYDTLYPPDPDRYLIEQNCVFCHGPNFFPNHKLSSTQWRASVELMTTVQTGWGAHIPPGILNDVDKGKIAAYLGSHFGPDSRTRALLIDTEMPVNEQALGRAMYIEYYLPIHPQLDRDTGQRRAQEPHIGLDGNVWYTDRKVPNRIGRLDPTTGEFKDYLLPEPTADPHGLTVDSEGYVFWAETRGLHLGRLNPRTGEMKRYPMDPDNEFPDGQGHTPVLDSQENVWFTVILGNRIGKWDRETEEITTWEVPTYNSWPYGILIDSNDKIWISEYHGCKVAQFDPVTERFTEYPAKTLEDLPRGWGCTTYRLGMDQETGTIYYGVTSHGRLGRIDINTGETVEYDIPMPYSEPFDVWTDEESNVWISDGGQGGALIEFDPATENFVYYPTPQTTDQPKLDISRNGGIWYSPRSSNKAAVGVLYPDMEKMTTLAAYR